jgi:hypothetical protein
MLHHDSKSRCVAGNINGVAHMCVDTPCCWCADGVQVLLLLAVDVLEHCVASVRQLKGITATYRMTAKGPPVRHSHYVAGESATGADSCTCALRCGCWEEEICSEGACSASDGQSAALRV